MCHVGTAFDLPGMLRLGHDLGVQDVERARAAVGRIDAAFGALPASHHEHGCRTKGSRAFGACSESASGPSNRA